MTRALVTQLLEALLTSSVNEDNLAQTTEAIKAAREYLATEPSGDRTELIEELRSRVVGDPFPLMDRAADMLEDDAQPKSFIRERAQLDQEWCELQKLKQAQQAKRVPMTMTERSAAWVAATIEIPSHENCYLRGMLDAESHHGIHAPK